MLQRLGLRLAVAMLAACGGSNKAATADASLDGGPGRDPVEDGGPKGPLVTNAGAACDGDGDCEGAGPTCQMTVEIPAAVTGPGAPVAVPFPGGYCTASCTTQQECGAGSECGVKKLIDTLGPLLTAMGVPEGVFEVVPSQCLALCKGAGDCRVGYVCQNLIDASGQGSMLPPGAGLLFARYCLPAIMPIPGADAGPTTPNMDGGMSIPDAGPALDAGRDGGV